MSRNGGIPGLAQAAAEQRGALGTGSSPTGLPPGLGLSGGIPRGGALNGVSENTGVPNASIIDSILRSAANAGGSSPRGRGSGRQTEQPSLARSNAISRRLNGNPSRGKELKGL